MIISEDSPTRRPPVTLDPRSVLYLDGIRYSTELLDLAFRRLEQNLENLTDREEAESGLGLLIVEAISDAWAFVDSFHRLRELVQQLPGLKQNQPQLQIFLRQSTQVKELRRYVQHLRNEIDDFVEAKMPLWGTVSWTLCNPKTGQQENHIIVPGTYFNDCRVVGCTFDTYAGQFIEKLVLHVGQIRVDLANLHACAAKFWQWFEEHVKPTFDSDKCHGSDVHFKFEIRPVKDAAPKEAT